MEGMRCAALLAAVALCAASPAAAKPFADLTPEGLPNVQSDAAFVRDAETGALVFAKNPDKVRAIASTGKIFAAMVVRRRGLELEGVTEITRTDVEYSKGGARTRMALGLQVKNIDLLRAMLIASDNRAPTALGRAVGLDPEELVAEMNALARELGLERTHFSCPSGLNGNTSTAREMVIALAAALEDPLLAEILGTEVVTVHTASHGRTIHYRNTNHALHSDRYQVTAGKTGYTDEARYCLIIAAEVDGRELLMAFLGAEGRLTRYGDFGRVAGWLKDRGEPADDTAVADTGR